MDITFEDVAHVIQDARYQQAILDTSARPDKSIPLLPRGFNMGTYVATNSITLSSVMSEPLGRWFLGYFADLDEKIRAHKSGREAVVKEEGKFLSFVAALYEVRRQDPDETASYREVLQLLREFKVDKLEVVKAALAAPGGKDLSVTFAAAVREAYSPEFAQQFEPPAELNGSNPAVGEADSMEEFEAEEEEEITAQDVELYDDEAEGKGGEQEEDKNGGKNGAAGLGTRETQVSRFDPTNKAQVARVTGAGAARTTTGAGGLRMQQLAERGSSPQRTHSARSIGLDLSMQTLMETVLADCYRRFVENRPAFGQYLRFRIFATTPIGDRQIRYHRVLGQGAFGTVHGCIVAQTGTMLAMKIMSKKRIKVKHSKSQVSAERFALEALARHPSPYCMRLRYAYQTKDTFHLILPLAIGGDLKFHLRQGPFEEPRAKFYAAEIAAGVGHIHSLGFIMRDLKPRNILLDSEGHCQISDFGLAASIMDGRLVKGRAGTEGYWSPAVIDSQPYGVDADWWSYGCCVFELLAGFNPFSCKHTGLASRNEGTRKAVVRYPKSVPASAKPLINGLLAREVSSRLGCGGGGVDEILNPRFSFWRGLDLGKIRRGNHPVPWVPEKGVIYAASQSEMLDNEDDPNGASLRKVKLTPDDIPEFDDFVDLHDHYEDIVKVLNLNADVMSILDNLHTGAKPRVDRNLRKKSLVGSVYDTAATGCGSCVIS